MNRRLLTTALSVALVGGALAVTTASRVGGVVHPRAAAVFTKGMNSKVTYDCQSAATWKADATNQVNGFLSLGATAIDLVFPLYTNAHNSDSIYARAKCGTGYQSPTPSQLSTVVKVARAAGMTVFVRPFLAQLNLQTVNPSFWHGDIRPAHPATWFANYERTLTPYLVMAQNDGVSSFAISDEFASMARFPEWHSVVSLAKSLYSGQLIFTSSWSTTGQMKWLTGTTLGVDTYRPVSDAKTSWTPKQLLGGWDLNLKRIPIPQIASTTIDEIGIAAQDTAYKGPNGVDFPLPTSSFSQQIQTNWFTAACAFVNQHRMQGIYYWGSQMTANGGALLSAPDPGATGAIQPMAQRAIKNCFGVGTAPVVTRISPLSGSTRGGTKVTVTGHNFIATFSVSVRGAAVPFTVVSANKITFTTPRSSKGTAPVVVTSEAGTSQVSTATAFTFKT